MIQAGAFRHRIIIQSLTDGSGVRGGITESWSEFATRWGSVSPLTGQERFAAQQIDAEVSSRIKLRYLEGVTPKMRVLVPKEHVLLNGAIDASQTTLVVDSASGFPTEGEYRIKIESEIINVTGGQGTTTWTVTRGVDGTTGATHADNKDVQRMGVYDIRAVLNIDERDFQLEFLTTERV